MKCLCVSFGSVPDSSLVDSYTAFYGSCGTSVFVSVSLSGTDTFNWASGMSPPGATIQSAFFTLLSISFFLPPSLPQSSLRPFFFPVSVFFLICPFLSQGTFFRSWYLLSISTHYDVIPWKREFKTFPVNLPYQIRLAEKENPYCPFLLHITCSVIEFV